MKSGKLQNLPKHDFDIPFFKSGRLKSDNLKIFISGDYKNIIYILHFKVNIMNRKFYVFIAMLAILLLSVSVASAANDTAADSNLTADSAAIDKIESENTQNSHVLQDDEWV